MAIDLPDSVIWNSERRPNGNGIMLIIYKGEDPRGSIFIDAEEKGVVAFWEGMIKQLNEQSS